MSGATRTQVYLTAEQRAGLDDSERDHALRDTFGGVPDLAQRVPPRDEWDYRSVSV